MTASAVARRLDASAGDDRPVLVTGATGYVGGRLVPELLSRGYRVRAMGRSLRKLEDRPWSAHPRVELAAADVFDAQALARACQGCGAAFYLVHSMRARGRAFAAADREAALNMARAAQEAGLSRIIYLGGLGCAQSSLSKHLRSRCEVADILRGGQVPVTVLRAAMIIGAGSASFEILRYLVDRLPVMVTPRWVRTPVQPIAIQDALTYLVGCLEAPATTGEVLDIGGPDVLTYRQLMDIYAEEAGLRRRVVIPVPVLTPRLSSYWIHLVTPLPASLARPLAEGLRNPVVCQDARILDLVPQRLIPVRDAIRRAIDAHQREIEPPTHWTDAGELPPSAWPAPGDPAWAGGAVLEETRGVEVHASPARAWEVVSRIGGRTGWYYADWLWRLRGGLDKLVGGVGLARGRREGAQLRRGDALDFWRVVEVDRPRRLTLAAEMRLPGQALLEFRLEPEGSHATRLTQVVRFAPRGLAGLAYWYAIYPLHALVFRGMLRRIASAAQSDAAGAAGARSGSTTRPQA